MQLLMVVAHHSAWLLWLEGIVYSATQVSMAATGRGSACIVFCLGCSRVQYGSGL